MKLILGLFFAITQIAFAETESCFDYAVPQISHCELDRTLPKEFKNYMKTQFQTEFKNALGLAGTIRGLNLQKTITLSIAYADYMNGVTRDTFIGVTFPRNKTPNLMEFRSTFFHELGHVLYNQYAALNSNTERTYLKIFNAKNLPMMTYMQVLTSHANVYKPAAELMADLFRVIFMQSPGVATRNFTRLPRINLEEIHGDEHNVYHPIRSYLWVNFLSKTICDSRRNMLLYRDVADATLRLQDDQFGGELNLVLSGQEPQEISSRTLNRRLADLLGFNLGL